LSQGILKNHEKQVRTVSDPRYESEKGLVSVYHNGHKSPQERCRRRKIQLMCGVAYLNKTFLMGAETKWMLIITWSTSCI
jgi:hypothetical protein